MFLEFRQWFGEHLQVNIMETGRSRDTSLGERAAREGSPGCDSVSELLEGRGHLHC